MPAWLDQADAGKVEAIAERATAAATGIREAV
jgi:hypothetical protein